MIVIIDNGLYASTISQLLKIINKESIIISSNDIKIDKLESLNIEAIIISNGLEKKDHINNSILVTQRFAWRVPILAIGLGAISVAILFNSKVTDTKIENINLFNINHDERTIFKQIKNDFTAPKWCKYTVCDEMLKKTDLEISARAQDEIVSFRHKNLAIEGLLFDSTSLSCEVSDVIIENFVKYYL